MMAVTNTGMDIRALTGDRVSSTSLDGKVTFQGGVDDLTGEWSIVNVTVALGGSVTSTSAGTPAVPFDPTKTYTITITEEP